MTVAYTKALSSEFSGRRLLSDLVSARTYAETKQNGKKETHDENVERVTNMHVKRFPKFEKEIREAFKSVHDRLVLPSMRTMQFAGSAIERSHARNYNCCATNVTTFRDFADIMWFSMNGCGVGFSVQGHHVEQLPTIHAGDSNQSVRIGDTKEDWASSIVSILENPLVRFDYSDIRPEGAKLSTGGLASGPKPLRDAHEHIRKILLGAVGRKLRPAEVHQIICYQSDAVVVGGVRRTALISLFSFDDNEMMTLKSGHEWRKHSKHLENANNSVVLYRNDVDVTEKMRIVMDKCFDGFSGEPGIFMTNDMDLLTNPCGEISLLDGQACNLSEINVAACRTKEEFMRAVRDATIIGTLQASYTDFNYVQSKWRKNCEKEALLGVSLTGQAENWQFLTGAMLQAGGKFLLETNETWAHKLGINVSARSGCTKPSGSASTYLMTTPGIHGAYDDFFLRRMIIEKNSPLAQHMMDVFGLGEAGEGCIVEQDYKRPGNIQIAAPHAAPDAINAGRESATSQLGRYKHIRDNWIVPTHRSGSNTHNVSMTCTYREEERAPIKEWMSNNIYCISGIAFFPHSGGTFTATQMPFESITQDDYATWSKKFDGKKLDLTGIDYNAYVDNRIGEVACAGGACLIL